MLDFYSFIRIFICHWPNNYSTGGTNYQ